MSWTKEGAVDSEGEEWGAVSRRVNCAIPDVIHDMATAVAVFNKEDAQTIFCRFRRCKP